MNINRTIFFAALVVLGSCGPEESKSDGGDGGGSGVNSGGGSGQQCSCTMTVNGDTQQTSVCGGLLCFPAYDAYYRCDVSGSTEISSCGSTGGGSGATGGGQGTTGGGSGSTGGGSASSGGGSGSAGGGTGATGGGSASPMCEGTFTCGASSCDSATQFCQVGCDTLNHVNTYACHAKTSSTCSSPANFCTSYISVSNCMSGRKATCSGDTATRGLAYGCECI